MEREGCQETLAFYPLAIKQRFLCSRVRTRLHFMALDIFEVGRFRRLSNFDSIKAEQIREYQRSIQASQLNQYGFLFSMSCKFS
jgi:hypothetical protein